MSNFTTNSDYASTSSRASCWSCPGMPVCMGHNMCLQLSISAYSYSTHIEAYPTGQYKSSFSKVGYNHEACLSTHFKRPLSDYLFNYRCIHCVLGVLTQEVVYRAYIRLPTLKLQLVRHSGTQHKKLRCQCVQKQP